MIWFGPLRTLTSLARWFFQFALPLIRPGAFYLLISPPFFRNQSIRKIPGDSKLVRIKINSYFDWATIHEIFGRSEYSLKGFPQETHVREHFQDLLEAKKTPLILDLGANIGLASIFFAREFPGCAVVGLEPSIHNFLSAVGNTKQEPAISILNEAVGPKDGQVEVRDPGIGNNAFRTFRDAPVSGLVQMVSVPTLLERYEGLTPFLMKVDIEGFESELFGGNVDWIDKFKVIVIETHDWMLPGKAVSQNLVNALSGRRRDLVFRGENLFSIRCD